MKILPASILEQLTPTPFPGFLSPMLATLTEDYFDDPEWIYERKLDGIRCEVLIENNNISLFTRNQNNISASYPTIIKALENQALPNAIFDGELVAFRGNKTSFAHLQSRMQEHNQKRPVKIFLYIFDILYFENYSLAKLHLRQRKNILKKAMEWQDPIRFTPHRNHKGTNYLKEACEKDWEGLIAKNADSDYVFSRSKNWLKFKCSYQQELVIGGFTEPQGERKGFGALLVGFYKDGKLQYAGKVGTGFDNAFLEKWRNLFDKIITKESPFSNYNDSKAGTNYWIKPKYVGQFGFTEWTKTNKLRHPRFLGMRTDKDAKDVIKEIPKAVK